MNIIQNNFVQTCAFLVMAGVCLVLGSHFKSADLAALGAAISGLAMKHSGSSTTN